MMETSEYEGRLDQMPPKVRQLLIIAVCMFLNAADGFDIMAMSYAAPGVSAAWNLSAEMLGILFSSVVIGTAVGAFTLAPLADFYGRRKTLLVAVLVVSLSMLVSTLAQNYWQLLLSRFAAGLGIGVIIPISTTLAGEFSPARIRATAVVVVAGGFSVGLFAAGVVAQELVGWLGWRAIFGAGCAITVVAMLLCLLFVEESPHFIASGKAPKAETARPHQPDPEAPRP
jgi:AAHS family 4-hydroxybenzoate transporter-like MFS transporter